MKQDKMMELVREGVKITKQQIAENQAKVRELVRDEDKLDSAVHAAVVDALAVLDEHFGPGIIKDDAAYKLDQLVKSALKAVERETVSV